MALLPPHVTHMLKKKKKLPELCLSIINDTSAVPKGILYCTFERAANNTVHRLAYSNPMAPDRSRQAMHLK